MTSPRRHARRGISVTATETAGGATPAPRLAAAVPITPGATIASKGAPPEAATTGIEPGSSVITGIGEASVPKGSPLDAANIATIPLSAELVMTRPSVLGDD
jgi:hypothetical protein